MGGANQRAHRAQVRQVGRPSRGPGRARCPARRPRPARPARARRRRRRVSWQSSSFCEPPPMTCTTSTVPVRSASAPAATSGGTPARDSPACSGPSAARDRGGSWPVARQCSVDPGGMLPGARNSGASAIDQYGERRARRPPRRAASAGRRSPQIALALLQDPQAHHVPQEPDPAVHATLVGEVRLPRRLASAPALQLQPDQRPGARGDVGEPLVPAAGTATTDEAVSCDPTAITGVAAGSPVSSATVRQQSRPTTLTGLPQRRQQSTTGTSTRAASSSLQSARADVVQLRGGGVRRARPRPRR